MAVFILLLLLLMCYDLELSFHNNKTDKNIQIFGCFNFLWNAPDDFTLYEN